jgi:hypothetical protein
VDPPVEAVPAAKSLDVTHASWMASALINRGFPKFNLAGL